MEIKKLIVSPVASFLLLLQVLHFMIWLNIWLHLHKSFHKYNFLESNLLVYSSTIIITEVNKYNFLSFQVSKSILVPHCINTFWITIKVMHILLNPVGIPPQLLQFILFTKLLCSLRNHINHQCIQSMFERKILLDPIINHIILYPLY